ncbi:hypothetical protein DFS34DRAFT_621518 [Phlyctochytrium arcticum]|nr:hypothetical protein DFS34DRAFT_621518 [Phlyctochytrium arcticum]
MALALDLSCIGPLLSAYCEMFLSETSRTSYWSVSQGLIHKALRLSFPHRNLAAKPRKNDPHRTIRIRNPKTPRSRKNAAGNLM